MEAGAFIGAAEASRLLLDGRTVALPTETVYGLAARADDASAIAAIYRLKGRPAFNPLIVHVPDMAAAEALAVLNPLAHKLAEAYWPGPLTLVLPRQQDAPVARAVGAGLETIAIRVPAHPIMQEVLQLAGVPLAAPSANRSNALSPTRPDHVRRSFGAATPSIVDGGACEAGVESTIIAVNEGWRVLRAGPIDAEVLTRRFGPPAKSRGATIEAPGQLERHYSPGKPMRLNATSRRPGEVLIGFGPVAGDLQLSAAGDLAEAAAALYDVLHQAADMEARAIAVAPIPDGGLGAAINDRLRRAAAR